MAEGRRGLVLVLTGDGKGKTTSAFGQALRAVGNGMQVAIVQFIKSTREPGEVRAAERLAPDLTVHVVGAGFIDPRHRPTEADRRSAREGLDLARRLAQDPALDLLVLDEVNCALNLGLLEVSAVLDLLSARHPALHVVLTGRRAPQALVDCADLVTDMRDVKHHYDCGVAAQPGIEE
jgi:cob(I)alamin adenosyltransferase